MFDGWPAEGALAPLLPQAWCPGLWPHAHCSVPAAGERMIEGPLRGTWVPGSAGSDLAGNRAQWQSTLCCGGKFPSVKMPRIVHGHARGCMCVCVCVCVRRWCLQSSYTFDYRAGVAMFTSLHKYLTYNVAMSCHHCSCPKQYFMFEVTTKITALLHPLFTCLFLWTCQLIWMVTEGELALGKLYFLKLLISFVPAFALPRLFLKSILH